MNLVAIGWIGVFEAVYQVDCSCVSVDIVKNFLHAFHEGTVFVYYCRFPKRLNSISINLNFLAFFFSGRLLNGHGIEISYGIETAR